MFIVGYRNAKQDEGHNGAILIDMDNIKYMKSVTGNRTAIHFKDNQQLLLEKVSICRDELYAFKEFNKLYKKYEKK